MAAFRPTLPYWLPKAGTAARTTRGMRVAVLYQASIPPIVAGSQPPWRVGSHQSSTDIAYALQKASKISIITPAKGSSPDHDTKWCFPDTEEGIVAAINSGATCLWANTPLSASHPLQTCRRLDPVAATIRVVGQPPKLMQAYEDKNFVNASLRATGRFLVARSLVAKNVREIESLLLQHGLRLPLVVKPVNGRDGRDVKVCEKMRDLISHVTELGLENALIEDHLTGKEVAVTVMPPLSSKRRYETLGCVYRNHYRAGVAQYTKAVEIDAVSEVRWKTKGPRSVLGRLSRQCKEVASLLRASAPIRIDARQASVGAREPYVIFDVNMQPDPTFFRQQNPEQKLYASLITHAASANGWNYGRLLKDYLKRSATLAELRAGGY